MKGVITWVKQPTTIAGIAALLGGVSGLLTGGLTWVGFIPIAISAVTGMIIPDNTAAIAKSGAPVPGAK
jgi:hypothetical protein